MPCSLPPNLSPPLSADPYADQLTALAAQPSRNSAPTEQAVRPLDTYPSLKPASLPEQTTRLPPRTLLASRPLGCPCSCCSCRAGRSYSAPSSDPAEPTRLSPPLSGSDWTDHWASLARTAPVGTAPVARSGARGC
eukprot:scaffold11986_cov127-Isochrysis_galbana.AAC.4